MQIYLVEDDEDLAPTISLAMDSRGFKTEVYPSAESFLESYSNDLVGCILLDLKLPGMSGIELQSRLVQLGCWQPIIFITGYGEIPDAVQAVRLGAVDFIEKPFKMNSLISVVEKAFDHIADCQKNLEQIAVLTTREIDVFELLAAGQTNKLVARELDIGLRTVEFHRKNIFEKLNAGSVSELVEIHRSLPENR